jgi:fucose 4-O-acetylase-like acetyltransferase
MSKRLLLLNGLAILAVVCNHATSFGFTALFWWTDRYLPVAVPNYDLLGSPAYYALVAIQQLALFSVPAFLFISGFFVAYAARGQENLSWKTVRTRITGLLWPYFIWMTIYLLLDALQGKTDTPIEYVLRLLTGNVAYPFFFVPLLIQFYLLAPFIVRWAKTRPAALLSTAITIQVLATVLFTYLQFAGQQSLEVVVSNGWLFIWHALYFPLGVVLGLRWNAALPVLARFRWMLVFVTIILGLTSIVENEWLRQILGYAPGLQAGTLSSSIYPLAFILAFMAFSWSGKGRVARLFSWLGTHSYGIYLMHILVLGWLARFIQHFFPWLLAQPVLFVLLLVALDIAILALFMKGVARSPARRWYRYLFG